MERLCERPGCSDTASVSYGMRPDDLVFWLDVLRSGDDTVGVLCRRHADSMVVPRNWTLDDLRDPELHLFRPPPPSVSGPRRTSRRRATGDDTQQLRLGEAAATPSPSAPGPSSPSPSSPSAAPSAAASAAALPATGVDPDSESDPVQPWTPVFDTDDDLDGLLAARSPLLARAFRGDRRGRRERRP